MESLEQEFQDLVEIAVDGFGRVLEGVRSGVRWTIRDFPTVQLHEIANSTRALMSRPVHPVVLPVDFGPSGDGSYIAAPVQGRLLSSLLRESDGEGLLRVLHCLEMAGALADAAATVADRNDPHLRHLGPLTPNNIYIDPHHPARVWIMPLWLAPARTCDWLNHSPDELIFLDRGMLRERPSRRSDVFAIGAVLLTLSRVAASERTVTRDAAEFIKSAVHGEHQFQHTKIPDGPLRVLIEQALGQAHVTALADENALCSRLAEVQRGLDPMIRAYTTWLEGKPFDAQVIIRRAIKGGSAPWALYLLRAHIEAEQGHRGRAARGMRALAQELPNCRAAWILLAELSDDCNESLVALREAVALNPLDLDVRLAFARALRGARQLADAYAVLTETRALAAATPGKVDVACVVTLELADLWLDMDRPDDAIKLLDEFTSSAAPRSLSADGHYIVGRALYKKREFADAIKSLREAVQIDTEVRVDGPRLALLNQLAYALVANREHVDAVSTVTQSLRMDPTQLTMIDLLRALGRAVPQPQRGHR